MIRQPTHWHSFVTILRWIRIYKRGAGRKSIGYWQRYILNLKCNRPPMCVTLLHGRTRKNIRCRVSSATANNAIHCNKLGRCSIRDKLQKLIDNFYKVPRLLIHSIDHTTGILSQFKKCDPTDTDEMWKTNFNYHTFWIMWHQGQDVKSHFLKKILTPSIIRILSYFLFVGKRMA